MSIGLPVYNAELYLRQAVDSILAQTYTDFELIISDNASADGTEAICREYMARDSRIRYIRNATNTGANVNFGRVLELARGRYFKWAAHDDVCHPTFLARCIEVLDADPSVVLCHPRTVLIDPQGRPVSREAITRGHFFDVTGRVVRVRDYDPPRQLDSPRSHERFRDIVLKTVLCFEIFGVIRTDLLRRTIGFRNLYYGADKVILAELSLLGRFVEVPEGLFFRRCHADQSGNLPTARLAALWSDPAVRWRLISQRLHCFRGYSRSVLRVELRPYERTRCMLVLARWPLRPGRWKAILEQRLWRLPRGASQVPRLS